MWGLIEHYEDTGFSSEYGWESLEGVEVGTHTI